MDDTEAIRLSESTEAPVDRAPRWSPFVTLATSGLMPARTATRTHHVSLKEAFVVHLVAAILAVGLLVFLVAWHDVQTSTFTGVIGILDRVAENAGEIADVVVQNAKFVVLVFLGVSLAIEAGFLALAFVVMPWGAGDEPLRSSYRHALRRTWL